MRYIDEVLALCPGKNPFTREFILAQILDHPADHFSGEIVDSGKGLDVRVDSGRACYYNTNWLVYVTNTGS